MLDREAFDKQVNSIRTRYQQLCTPPSLQQPSTQGFQTYYTPSPTHQPYVFATPTKVDKTPYEESISFGTIRAKELQVFESKALSVGVEEVFPRDRKGARIGFRKGCYSISREQSGRGRDICEDSSQAQKVLLKRVHQNERLLIRSQQMRQYQTQRASTVKQQKKSVSGQFTLALRNTAKDNACSMDKKNNKYDMTNAKQTRYGVANTERRGGQDSLLGRLKGNTDQNSVKSRTAFNQKMNQILQNFNRKTPLNNKADQNCSPCLKNIEPRRKMVDLPLPNYDQARVVLKGRGEAAPAKKDLKVVSVFQNTQNIQQRLKAILHYS